MTTRRMLTADEEGVASENSAVVAVFKQEADAVLGVARRVETLNCNVTELEPGAVGGGLCDGLAVLTTNDGYVRGPQLADLVPPTKLR